MDQEPIEFDINVLNSLGFDMLPEVEKESLLQYLYDQLEFRVGTVLSDGLSDDQLEEFEKITDGHEPTATAWLSENLPDFRSSEEWKQLNNREESDPEGAIIDFAGTQWLRINVPNYREQSRLEFNRIKEEASEWARTHSDALTALGTQAASTDRRES